MNRLSFLSRTKSLILSPYLLAALVLSLAISFVQIQENALAKDNETDHADIMIGDIEIENPWIRADIPTQTNSLGNTAAYLTIENEGEAVDYLIAASSPAATSVSIHQSTITDNIVKMVKIEQLPLPINQDVIFTPGSYHLMLSGLKYPLLAGMSVPIELSFKNNGNVTIQFIVKAGQPN